MTLWQTKNKQTTALRPFNPGFQDKPGEPVLSQSRELPGTTIGFDWAGCPTCHSIYSVKALYRKTQWFGPLFFIYEYKHGISTPCLTNSVKALKDAVDINQYYFYVISWRSFQSWSSILTERRSAYQPCCVPPVVSSSQWRSCAVPRPSSRSQRRSRAAVPAWRCTRLNDGSHPRSLR